MNRYKTLILAIVITVLNGSVWDCFAQRPAEEKEDAITHWLRIEMDRQEIEKALNDIDERSTDLLGALVEAKREYRPGELDPQNVIVRKRIEDISKELANMRRQGRRSVMKAMRFSRDLQHDREHLETLLPALKAAADAGSLPQPENAEAIDWPETIERWKRLLAAMGEDNQREAIQALFGERGGMLLLHMPRGERNGRPFGQGEKAGRMEHLMGPRIPEIDPELKQQWLTRLQRLEKQHEELKHVLDQQNREIERLKRMIEGEYDLEGQAREDGFEHQWLEAPPRNGDPRRP